MNIYAYLGSSQTKLLLIVNFLVLQTSLLLYLFQMRKQCAYLTPMILLAAALPPQK